MEEQRFPTWQSGPEVLFRTCPLSFVFFEPERWARFLYPRTLGFVLELTVLLIGLSLLVRIKATLKLDTAATLALQRWSAPWADRLMVWFTWLGNSMTLVTLCGASALIALFVKDVRTALFLGLTLLSLPINIVLKNIFDRERPGEKEVKVHPGPRWGFSYPSGHSMGSAAFYGFVAFLVHLSFLDPAVRWALSAPFLMLPVLVGASRIYLGAHWLSDVVGGIAGGAIIVAVLAVLYPV